MDLEQLVREFFSKESRLNFKERVEYDSFVCSVAHLRGVIT